MHITQPGPLMFEHTNGCPLRAAEDARAIVDRDDVTRAGTSRLALPLAPAAFTRPATSAERTLLVALGYGYPRS